MSGGPQSPPSVAAQKPWVVPIPSTRTNKDRLLVSAVGGAVVMALSYMAMTQVHTGDWIDLTKRGIVWLAGINTALCLYEQFG